MKPSISIPCSAWKIPPAFTRMMFSACVAVAFLAAPTLISAQASQAPPAKTTKTSQKTKAAQPAKSKSSGKVAATKTTSVAHNPAPYRRKLQAETGVEARDEALDGELGADSPNAAAREAYAARAYPAAYVPQAVTSAARQGWANFKAADAKRPKNPGEIKQWTFYPLSTQEFPAVLSFSGRPYYDSGRITALAIAPTCQAGNCRVWVAAAGGGVWRTDDALATNPAWTFISGSFATNAIGILSYDAGTGTLYAGTGEANASSDSEAGFGIYKSTDGGDTWTKLAGQTSVASGSVDCTAVVGSGGVQTAPAYSGGAFDGRAISSIVVNGSTMYVGSTRAVRGVSAVTSGGAVSLAPGLPPYGIWKSTDGGATFTLLSVETACLNPTLANSAGIIQTSFGSTRGVNHIELDPSDPSTVYAAAFPRNNALPVNTGGGVWRSNDGGATWAQIKSARNATNNTDRAEFAVTKLPGGTTRMYVGIGNSSTSSANAAHFYRSDDVAAGSPVFTDMTTTQNINYCTSQCWYDNFVKSPAGYPDTVYLGGSFDYNTYGFTTDGRGVLYSTDAGASFTDMTWDANFKATPSASCCQPNPVAPNGIHPDQHALVVSPTNPGLFFEGSDGGLMRTSGGFTDISGQCSTYRGLSGTNLTLCQQLLSRVPSTLYSLNRGLSTLQFQGISVNPQDVRYVQGGTQDNGTWIANWSAGIFAQEIYGDGGQSGFSSTNSNLHFNTFTGKANDVNFNGGDPLSWVIASGPIYASSEGSQFYPPVIADPSTGAPQTIFQGSTSVWRTQDWGGDPTYLLANCPEFTTSAANTSCGDFVRIGPSGATDLTVSAADYRGTTRSGGNVGAISRTPSNTGTMWAATTVGRVFISTNADNPTAGAVSYARLDNMPSATASPGRFVSGIFIDPKNSNHAWISYSSYSSLDPTTPGHIFSVTYDPTGNGGLGDATWTSLDGSGATAFPDFPATSITWDPYFGIFASNDWGVLRLPLGSTNWQVAGTGLPMVEVTHLVMVPGARRLYAATHGRSIWYLQLN
jgi:hypothetical protein